MRQRRVAIRATGRSTSDRMVSWASPRRPPFFDIVMHSWQDCARACEVLAPLQTQASFHVLPRAAVVLPCCQPLHEPRRATVDSRRAQSRPRRLPRASLCLLAVFYQTCRAPVQCCKVMPHIAQSVGIVTSYASLFIQGLRMA